MRRAEIMGTATIGAIGTYLPGMEVAIPSLDAVLVPNGAESVSEPLSLDDAITHVATSMLDLSKGVRGSAESIYGDTSRNVVAAVEAYEAADATKGENPDLTDFASMFLRSVQLERTAQTNEKLAPEKGGIVRKIGGGVLRQLVKASSEVEQRISDARSTIDPNASFLRRNATVAKAAIANKGTLRRAALIGAPMTGVTVAATEMLGRVNAGALLAGGIGIAAKRIASMSVYTKARNALMSEKRYGENGTMASKETAALTVLLENIKTDASLSPSERREKTVAALNLVIGDSVMESQRGNRLSTLLSTIFSGGGIAVGVAAHEQIVNAVSSTVSTTKTMAVNVAHTTSGGSPLLATITPTRLIAGSSSSTLPVSSTTTTTIETLTPASTIARNVSLAPSSTTTTTIESLPTTTTTPNSLVTTSTMPETLTVPNTSITTTTIETLPTPGATTANTVALTVDTIQTPSAPTGSSDVLDINLNAPKGNAADAALIPDSLNVSNANVSETLTEVKGATLTVLADGTGELNVLEKGGFISTFTDLAKTPGNTINPGVAAEVYKKYEEELGRMFDKYTYPIPARHDQAASLGINQPGVFVLKPEEVVRFNEIVAEIQEKSSALAAVAENIPTPNGAAGDAAVETLVEAKGATLNVLDDGTAQLNIANGGGFISTLSDLSKTPDVTIDPTIVAQVVNRGSDELKTMFKDLTFRIPGSDAQKPSFGFKEPGFYDLTPEDLAKIQGMVAEIQAKSAALTAVAENGPTPNGATTDAVAASVDTIKTPNVPEVDVDVANVTPITTIPAAQTMITTVDPAITTPSAPVSTVDTIVGTPPTTTIASPVTTTIGAPTTTLPVTSTTLAPTVSSTTSSTLPVTSTTSTTTSTATSTSTIAPSTTTTTVPSRPSSSVASTIVTTTTQPKARPTIAPATKPSVVTPTSTRPSTSSSTTIARTAAVAPTSRVTPVTTTTRPTGAGWGRSILSGTRTA
jgi:hypothetical protein